MKRGKEKKAQSNIIIMILLILVILTLIVVVFILITSLIKEESEQIRFNNILLKGKIDYTKINVVSRGFVFMREAESVIDFIKQTTEEIIKDAGKQNDNELRRLVKTRMSKKLFKVIQRNPVIVPAFIDL